MKQPLGVPLAVFVAVLCASCGGKSTPTVPTTTAPITPPPPTISRLVISGNTALTTIGGTSQLTATATYSDNSTKEVTSDGSWAVNDPRIVAIDRTGVLTVLGYGSTNVSFSYLNRGAGTTVSATPAGTFIIAGRIREPGQGGLGQVNVVDLLTGRTVVTDASGLFSMAQLPSLRARFRVAINGYEPAELDATTTFADIPVQQVVRVTAGETVSPPHGLAPNDLSYTVGADRCDDCRLIRVVSTRTGSLRVHVTWKLTATRFRLFAQGQIAVGGIGDLTADTQITAPGEVLMYLGVMPGTNAGHTPFTFATSWN